MLLKLEGEVNLAKLPTLWDIPAWMFSVKNVKQLAQI